MVSFTAYCVLFTYYTFYRFKDWGPLAVAQSAPSLNPPLFAAKYKLHISRGDVEKYCLIIFSAHVME